MARIEFVLADLRSFAARILNPTSSALCSESSYPAHKIDVVFLSPPWGGPEYFSAAEYQLARTSRRAAHRH